jgi:general L-amino acid transport system permease protein
VILAAGILVFVRTVTPILLFVGVAALGVLGYAVGTRIPRSRRWVVVLAVVAGIVAAFVVMTMFGGVSPGRWGGFWLNMVFAVFGILLCYPVGVLLALGRRSSLPAIRLVCITYIEVFRALPLIALLFMGWLILPFFLPQSFPTPDVIWRALIIFIMFSAAYIAEIVRGGLQSIPKGQHEAAYALGLRASTIQRLVILPQALRNVIPATVGQFISLYKDTSLVLIIGITDILAVGNLVTEQPGFRAQGLHAQSLLFVAFIFWMGCYWMSRESQRMEQRLGLGER